LGGYVRMLDEREAPVPEAERHLAFNTQPLRSRAAIVAAGPIANLLLAVLLYSVVNWSGVQEPKALLASPVAGSVAQAAGLRGGELVHGAALGSGELEPVRSFEDLRWLLTRGALEGERVRLEVEPTPGALHREVLLDMEQIDAREADAQLFRKVGLLGPWTRPVLGEIMADSAAQRAGLRQGDVVQKIGAVEVVDGQQLRELIRQSVRDDSAVVQPWRIERGGQQMTVDVMPDVHKEQTGSVGRIGAYVGAPPEFVTVQYGPLEGAWNGIARTWDVSVLTLRMMGRMVTWVRRRSRTSAGPSPLPTTRAARPAWADTVSGFPGAHQRQPWGAEPAALACPRWWAPDVLSLGGRDGQKWKVTDAWMEHLQRGGVAVLLLMMSIALFNDITRLFG
jgi:regulator of sigma E protease